jgi:hypothetical protein
MSITVYIIPNRHDRRKVINYVEKNLPDMFACSLKCESLPSEKITYYKCEECDCIRPMEYSRGSMKNNQDEYYSAHCCGNYVSFEPNYDSYCETFFPIFHGNVVAMWNGSDYKGWQYRDTAVNDNITEEEYNKILSNYSKIELPTPHGVTYSKRSLTKHIDEYLKG